MNILDNLTKTPNLKKYFGQGGEWEGGGKRLKKIQISGGGGGGSGS